MPKVIQVIVSEVLRGRGLEEDVARTVIQYHTLEGEFLAELDPMPMERYPEHAVASVITTARELFSVVNHRLRRHRKTFTRPEREVVDLAVGNASLAVQRLLQRRDLHDDCKR